MDIELINKYNEWVTYKKANANDYSAEAFQLHLYKETALERMIEAYEVLKHDADVEKAMQILEGNV